MNDNLKKIIVKVLIKGNKEKIKPKSIQYGMSRGLDNILNFKEFSR